MPDQLPRNENLRSALASQVHVILVEPGDSLNIGAAARAMMNLGFEHLRLVAPRDYDPDRAAATACWAADILAQLQIYDTLEAAAADTEDVIGFTVRAGRHRPPLMPLPEWAAALAKAPLRKTALVFGPEEAGLTADHVKHCRLLVRIPSVPENPSYNLAQAVLLALYELQRAFAAAPAGPAYAAPLPTWKEFQKLDEYIEALGRRSDFFHTGTPPSLPDEIKHLFRRLQPDARELNILTGYFARLIQTQR